MSPKYSFRLNEIEEKIFDEKFEKSGAKTKSEFIREFLMKEEIEKREALKDFAYELKKIGNNINQLTKAYHAGLLKDENKELEKANEELKKLWQILHKVLKG